MEHRSGQDIEISTHAPAGGATLTPDAVCSGVIFLLTPLREGRRSATRRLFPVFVISTHAPAGGATLRYHPCGNPGAISTHAPAGGATVIQHGDIALVAISTHAPAGGATSGVNKYIYSHTEFLLTPLREGRLQSPATVCRGTIFLLTPLREGRPSLR